MREVGRVIEIKEDYALVNVKRKSACGSCCACELGSSKKPEVDVKARRMIECEVGDYVYIEMTAPDMLRASAIAYGIPLLALMFGIVVSYLVLGDKTGASEGLSFFTGLVFMGISFAVIHRYDNKLKESRKYEPALVELAARSEFEPLLAVQK